MADPGLAANAEDEASSRNSATPFKRLRKDIKIESCLDEQEYSSH